MEITKELKRLNQNIEKLISIYEKSLTAQGGNEPAKQAIRLGDLYIKESDDSCSLLDFVRAINHSVGREEHSKRFKSWGDFYQATKAFMSREGYSE